MAITTSEIWEFADKKNQIITSHRRVEVLKRGGFLFEACAVQSVVLESLIFFLIVSRAIHRKMLESKKIRQGLGKLTIGGLIKRAKQFSLLGIKLIEKLEEFKEKRNFLFHHHLNELTDFDYVDFLSRNEVLISHLFKHHRIAFYEKMKQLGIPDADKLK